MKEVENSSLCLGDVDGDGARDVFLTGMDTGGTYYSKMYINDGSGNFTDNSTWPTNIPGVGWGCCAFADVDNDGDLDLGVGGRRSSGSGVMSIYNNTGSTYTLMANLSNATGWGCSIGFGDIFPENGSNDLVVQSVDGNGSKVRTYAGNGEGDFTQVASGVNDSDCGEDGAIFTGDVDGDGDQEIACGGWDGSQYSSAVYDNTAGNFASLFNALWGGQGGAFMFIDYDGDQDLDLWGYGRVNGGALDQRAYTFNGTDFNQDSNWEVAEAEWYNTAFAVDADNDGDLDIVRSVGPESYPLAIAVLENNGAGFTVSSDFIPKSDIFNYQDFSVGALGDVTGDRIPDLMYSGRTFSDTSDFCILGPNVCAGDPLRNCFGDAGCWPTTLTSVLIPGNDAGYGFADPDTSGASCSVSEAAGLQTITCTGISADSDVTLGPYITDTASGATIRSEGDFGTQSPNAGSPLTGTVNRISNPSGPAGSVAYIDTGIDTAIGGNISVFDYSGGVGYIPFQEEYVSIDTVGTLPSISMEGIDCAISSDQSKGMIPGETEWCAGNWTTEARNLTFNITTVGASTFDVNLTGFNPFDYSILYGGFVNYTNGTSTGHTLSEGWDLNVSANSNNTYPIIQNFTGNQFVSFITRWAGSIFWNETPSVRTINYTITVIV
ncbi:FG-GAP repeat domain-containing protein [Nanoarchaeota archaeon]